MSIDAPAAGLAFWLPALVAALDTDPCGAGAQLRAVVTGRTARIGLDHDVVIVESVAEGRLRVRADDPTAACDGSGFTTTAVVLALLDGEVGIDQVVWSGGIDIRSPTADALWMYRIIELLLDGAGRVPRLRELARRFREQAGPAPRQPLVDWRAGAGPAESALLARLGLLADDRVDRHG